MSIIFGVRRVKKPARYGLRLRRYCERCHLVSEMQEHDFKPYFTLFFIPVVPVGKGESLLVCGCCQAVFYPQAEDYLAADGQGSGTADEKAVITCAYCHGRLRVPALPGRRLLVTCPHCKERFDLELNERG